MVKQVTNKPSLNGKIIVGIDSQNCSFFSGLDGASDHPVKERIYYRINDGSKLSDEQVIASVRGYVKKISVITTFLRLLMVRKFRNIRQACNQLKHLL